MRFSDADIRNGTIFIFPKHFGDGIIFIISYLYIVVNDLKPIWATIDAISACIFRLDKRNRLIFAP